MKKTQKLKGTEIVEKRNVLNDILSDEEMTLQELRFFAIYLSKINPRDISTRIVRFPLSDFQTIMDYGRMNIAQLKDTTDSLLCKIIHVPTESGGYKSFQLFKECTVDKDSESGNWYVEIDAHDKSLPLMFDYKKNYFKYAIWNTLRLKSKNQFRMYEILKQYELIGERTITVDKLRKLLGISRGKYTKYNSLKVDVIDVCQKALETYTDISFTYAPAERKGIGGKITSITFTITSNTPQLPPISLEDFINDIPNADPKQLSLFDTPTYSNDIYEFLAEACDFEFNDNEMSIIFDTVNQKNVQTDIEKYDFILKKYHELCYAAQQREITNRFKYFLAIIRSDNEK